MRNEQAEYRQMQTTGGDTAEDAGPLASTTPMPDLLAFALRRAASIALNEFQTCLASESLRPIQFAIMAMLHCRPGVRQSQLSPALGIRRTNLVPLLSELEGRGLCERRPVPGDRRAAALFLTSYGQAIHDRCRAEARAHDDRLAARIGPSGRDELLSLLLRVGNGAPDQLPDQGAGQRG